jgi:hypothetical protein
LELDEDADGEEGEGFPFLIQGQTVKPSIDFGDIRSDHFSLSPEIDFSID